MGSYSDLSRLMSEHSELLILRKYSNLNVRSLLYYQAELAHLEVELKEVESEDRNCAASPRKKFATSWKSFTTSPECVSLMTADRYTREPSEQRQWQIFCRIRSVLHEYNEALVQYGQVAGMLSKTRYHNLRNLRKWLERPEYGNSFMQDDAESVWDVDKGFEDLCGFETQELSDAGLTYSLGKIILHLRRRWNGSRKPSNHVYALDESTEQWIANGIMTVVSSVFPVLPIVILFFVNQLLVRLGLILVFTAIFAGALVFGIRLEPDKTLAITRLLPFKWFSSEAPAMELSIDLNLVPISKVRRVAGIGQFGVLRMQPL